MPKLAQDAYDAVIIGAGIGGLVCGCYLAKAGMKVLIAEQHFKPGGYCTSFKRKGFTFDAAADCFGAYRKDGITRKVFEDLGIDKKLNIIRFDPPSIILTPDYKLAFWNDHNKLISELQEAFPNEKKINEFIMFLVSPRPADIAAMKNRTFKDLLDRYFADNRLQSILSYQLFVNGGLPPSLMSAFAGLRIFTEFVLDGGYYPNGGMQALPDALTERFKEFGGEIRLSALVKRIRVKDTKVEGVVLEEDGFIPSKYVVSNCDARQTFFELLGDDLLSKELAGRLNTMTPSLSMFILYLGIDEYFDALPKPCVTLYYLPHYNLEDMYLSAWAENSTDLKKYSLRVSPDGRAILAMANTSFKNKQYWENKKHGLIEHFTEIIEQSAIRDLSKHIVYKEAATPHTLYRYTLNYKGAAYGWASTPNQIMDPDFRKPSTIENLYLTGHWTTYGQGIAGVVYLGYDMAKSILRTKKKCTIPATGNY